MKVDLFEGVQLINLLYIAQNIIQRKYKLGEFILAAGETPEGLYLIKKGNCKIGLDEL